MTFYLKYRPKKIEELDLVDVRDQLKKILRSGRIPHAFLFAGPRGAGKTSAARILAKAVNCQKQQVEPCNQCDQCKAIDFGSSLDVIEIDAASNRGVDDIRALRETVKLAAVSGKKKVYIIDEAHMLTTEASNALLKTLEEPPRHVMFILATTQPEKLLDTIRSRCTTIVFRKAKEDEIIKSLKKVREGEGLKVGDDVLAEIAKNVDGSFREAHKILEQLSFSGGEITVDNVRSLISLPSDPSVLVKALANKDVKGALNEIAQVTEQGVSLRFYASQVVQILRKTLLSEFVEGYDNDFDAEEFGGIEELKEALRLFSQAAYEVPAAVIPQLPLELAAIKWCTRLGKKESFGNQKHKEKIKTSSDKQSVKVQTVRKDILPSWQEIMQSIKSRNTTVEALLRATRPQAFDGKTLTIEVFYQFHKERLEKEPYRTIIEEVLRQVLGTPVRLVCILADKPKRARDLINVSEEVEEDIAKLAEEIFGGRKNDKTVN